MHPAPAPEQTLAHLLPGPFVLGPRDAVGALTVFAIVGAPTNAKVLCFSDAIDRGAVARELPGEPSVNDLLIENPLGHALLLLDGEEVLGAQQNRVFDGTLIVPAFATIQVAVCCVEQGRWDGRRQRDAFRSAAHVAHPELRREMAHSRVQSVQGRASQALVWSRVADRVQHMGTATMTAAMADIYAQRDEELDHMLEQLPLNPAQLGMLAFIGNRPVALDWVGEPEAFARLHHKLVRGYAMQALDQPTPIRRPASKAASRVLDDIAISPITPTAISSDGPRGSGHAHRIGAHAHAATFTGTATELEGHLLTCSVFPA